MVWEGRNVIAGGRKLIGATNPDNAEPGSIRGDLCIQTGRNIIHGSDSKDSAEKEINLWFKKEDVRRSFLLPFLLSLLLLHLSVPLRLSHHRPAVCQL